MTKLLGLLPKLVIILAVGTVAAAAAPLVWQLRGHDRIVPAQAVLPPPTAEADAGVDLGPVLQMAPFGQVAVEAAPETPETAPSLDLTLLGVIVRDDPARSLALIASPEGEANYRIGDAVTDSLTLSDVAESFVLLDQSGETIRLAFDNADMPELADEDVPSGEDRLAAIMSIGQGETISARNDAAQRAVPVTTQDYIDLWRDRIRANPAEVLDAIGLVPTENGYIVAEKHDSGVNRAGMRAGDIVRSVNGQTVGDIDSDTALYDRVAEQGIARVEIERNGRTIVMSFPLQ